MTSFPRVPDVPGLTLQPGEDGRLRVSFSYHPDTVARIKTIPGRRWHTEEKCWSIPHTDDALDRLRALFTLQPPKAFPQKPPAVSKRRWERLSPAEQAFLTPVEDELKLRGYSPQTRKAYRNHLLRFRRALDGDPAQVAEGEIRRYLLYLIDEKKVSRAYLNQAISALKFYFDRVLRKPKVVGELPRPRRESTLPVVLSRAEVMRIFAALGNPKHRALLMVAYSAGLRVSEVVRLKREDIDVDRKMIRVHREKGRKDRYVRRVGAE